MISSSLKLYWQCHGCSSSFIQRPLLNKLQATERYINRSSWCLFCSKRGATMILPYMLLTLTHEEWSIVKSLSVLCLFFLLFAKLYLFACALSLCLFIGGVWFKITVCYNDSSEHLVINSSKKVWNFVLFWIFLENVVNSVNQVSCYWKAPVIPFPTTSHELQSIIFERRYALWCAKIQHFECWPVNPPIKVIWSEKNDHRIATLLMTGIAHSNLNFPTLMVMLVDYFTSNCHK